MFLCDYHIHTKYSFDGDICAAPEAICEAAIERGLTDIAITDHFDVNAEPEGLEQPYNPCTAYDGIMKAREIYGKKLNITYGIEIGQANQYPEIANKFLSQFPVEFVLASLHNLRNMPDFYYMDFSKIDEDEINRLYFAYLSELEETIARLDRTDSIGHITYPYRYAAGAGKKFDCSPFCDRLSELFSLIISRDIAIEVNTSTYTKGYGFTMPDSDILSLYRECGGTLITLGSDAHTPGNVGASIPYALDLVKKTGFDNILVIRGGNRELIKI